MMIAHLFRRFELELYDTNEEQDILTKYDSFIGIAERSTKGVTVKVLGERKE